jgi:hypothetical protein
MQYQVILAMTCTLLASGCANNISKATSIGDDKYIMTAQAKPSPFGVASGVNMGRLIEEASASCTQRGLRFVLLDQQQNEGNTFKLGNGSVTYKCEK